MFSRILINLSKQHTRLPRYTFSSQSKPQPQKQTQIPKEEPTQPPPQQPWKKTNYEDDFAEEQQTFQKQNRNTLGWWIYRFFFWGSFSILSYNIYLVYNHKKKTPVDQEIGAVPVFITIAKNIVKNFNDTVQVPALPTQFVTQPTSKKLLYDPVHPDLHPKTLILNLTGTIIQSQYIFGRGIKTTLRPGLQNLLKRLSQKYEIVIFAEQDQFSIMNKLTKVDPKQMHIRGVLGREAMVWKNGQFIKDLKYLNRDLRKVVVIDRKIQNVKNHPENTIIIPQFEGDQKDIQLNKLAILLQRMTDVPDVRKFLAQLGQNPVEKYYERAKQAQQKINKKASYFGAFTKDPKKDRA